MQLLRLTSNCALLPLLLLLLLAAGSVTCLPAESAQLTATEGLSYLRKFGYLPADSPPLGAAVDLSSAVTRFQTVFQLPLTGRLDAATLAAMRQGRCGVSDDAALLPAASSVVAQRNRRATQRHPRFQADDPTAPPPLRFHSPKRVTWQLRQPDHRIAESTQRRLLAMAFRHWSQVVPVRFVEVAAADSTRGADIEIGFYTRRHLNCRHSFDGKGGETSHARAAGWIHLDGDETFGHGADAAAAAAGDVDLLWLLVHEIGHSLGLPHLPDRRSVMHPAGAAGAVPGLLPRIGAEEIRLVQRLYGPCSTRIDAMSDWAVAPLVPAPSLAHHRKLRDSAASFVTRVISCDSVWQLDGSRGAQELASGPDSLGRRWPGLRGVRVDALMQIRLPAAARSHPVTLLFSGSKYFRLDSTTGHPLPGYPRNISDDFGPKFGHRDRIPSSLDTAYYDNSTARAVFIKDNWVYEYEILGPNSEIRKNNCCHKRTKLTRKFAVAKGHKPLATPLDAAYLRTNDSTLFLLSGDDFWRSQVGGGGRDGNGTGLASGTNATLAANATPAAARQLQMTKEPQILLSYGGKVFQQWPGLCAVDTGHQCDLRSHGVRK